MPYGNAKNLKKKDLIQLNPFLKETSNVLRR